MMESEVLKMFCKGAKFAFGQFLMDFNGKMLSSDTIQGLYKKLKSEIVSVQKSK